jgi:hypothetical protein
MDIKVNEVLEGVVWGFISVKTDKPRYGEKSRNLDARIT